MHEWQSLSHVRWECKYHVVFIPKYRRKVIYGSCEVGSDGSFGICATSVESSLSKGTRWGITFTCA